MLPGELVTIVPGVKVTSAYDDRGNNVYDFFDVSPEPVVYVFKNGWRSLVLCPNGKLGWVVTNHFVGVRTKKAMLEKRKKTPVL